MSIWELRRDGIQQIDTTTFGREGVLEEQHLRRTLAKNVKAIGEDLLVIAEEYSGWVDSRRRIDILAIDKAANLVVIELKRTDTGGHMELQAIRYAAMVSTVTFGAAVDTLQRYLKSQDSDDDAESVLLDFLEWQEPNEEDFANDVAIVLAAADFSTEITSAVLWLLDHGVDIRCLRIRPHNLEGRVLLDIQQIVPLREAAEYQVQVREKVAEQRSARRVSRAHTRYDLTIGDKVYSAVPKRRLIYHVARAAVEVADVAPEEFENLGFGARRWASVDGECNEEQFLHRLAMLRTPRGNTIDPRRYFTAENELIRFRGRTYAFSNQWGKNTAELVDAITERYPELGASYKETVEQSSL